MALRALFLTALLGLSLLGATATRADDATLLLELKDHKFQPANPTVPAGTKVKVTVRNLDPTPAEFESQDFDAEKVIPPNGQITVIIGPLDPGTYDFYDEYHEQESTTQLTVK